MNTSYRIRTEHVGISPKIQNHHWIKILPSFRAPEKARSRIIGDSDFRYPCTIRRKWVPNIYIQIQGMSQKRNIAEEDGKKRRKSLSKINSISFSLIAHDSRRTQKKKECIRWNIFNEYLCVLCCPIHLSLCTRADECEYEYFFFGPFYRFFWINFGAHLQIRHAHARKRKKRKGKPTWDTNITSWIAE